MVDVTSVVEIESLEAGLTPPTSTVAPTVDTSGTTSTPVDDTPSTVPSSTSWPLLTQAILY